MHEGTIMIALTLTNGDSRSRKSGYICVAKQHLHSIFMEIVCTAASLINARVFREEKNDTFVRRSQVRSPQRKIFFYADVEIISSHFIQNLIVCTRTCRIICIIRAHNSINASIDTLVINMLTCESVDLNFKSLSYANM